MLNKRWILFFFVLLFIGCPSPKVADAPKDWIYGTWVTEKVSSDIVAQNAIDKKGPVEKHAMVFYDDGKIKRIAKNKKALRLMMEFRMNGTLLELKPFGQDKFSAYGEIQPDGMMKMYISKDSYYVYKKLVNPFSEKDLDGIPLPDIE